MRVHAVQELLAGLGVASGVALVFAALIANGSVAASARAVVHAVAGPASLQLRARDSGGLDQSLLKRVQHLPGVIQAAPLLEQTATVTGPHGRRLSVNVAGTNLSFGLLNGLAHTLPIAVFSAGSVALSDAAAEELGVSSSTSAVSLEIAGRVHQLKVAAILGQEAAGALHQARVAIMPLERLQRLAGLPRRLTRILIKTRHGQEPLARAALQRLAGGRLSVVPADEDASLLDQALKPSDQASAFFAAISALLGFLFAFNAMLLTVPERRQAIAELRLIGTKRLAVVQIVAFQALCLGIAASAVGLIGGYALSLSVFHQSSGYLAEAFTLGTSTVVGATPLVVSLIGGIFATFLASAVPLLDMRRGRALDAVYFEDGSPGNALGGRIRLRLGLSALALLALTSALFALLPSLALLASALLALATVCAVPLVFSGILWLGAVVARRRQTLTIVQVALSSLRSATLRSLALAATGAVAIFGGIALGGSRDDLLRGIAGFAHSYAADAQLWVANPEDNQATVTFHADSYVSRIARLPGVASVQAFQGGFLELGDRRAWVIARPPGGNSSVLGTQTTGGSWRAAASRLAEGGWIAVSQQIAEEQGVRPGGTLALPTPTGEARLRLAATTTNLAWSPGVVFIGTRDYRRLWATDAPTALGIDLRKGASVSATRDALARTLGPSSGLEVASARTRERRIDTLTSEGLGRLGEISTLLVIAAILAMAAALGSSIWQRRASLAALRLSGVRAARLRRILLIEAVLMLGAGCLVGALAGIYGQVIIDGYLKQVTGFPVASLAASGRPFAILAIVIVIVLLVAAVPAWSASRVSPTVALDDRSLTLAASPLVRPAAEPAARQCEQGRLLDRGLAARAGVALARANARYWSTVAPLVREQLARWHSRALAISDPALRELALEKLEVEGFNAEVAATLATLVARAHRRDVVEAIVALEILYDFLDGLTESPSPQAPHDGRALFGAFIDATSPAFERGGDYYRHHPCADESGYLEELVDTVRSALATLPGTSILAEAMQSNAMRSSEAQLRIHALQLTGAGECQRWADTHAAGTSLEWREFLAGAASSVLGVHALISAAADPRTTRSEGLQIDRAYLSISALPTVLDSLADYDSDAAAGHAGFALLYEDREVLQRRLVLVTRDAIERARELPNAAHHVMTIVGIVAYYASDPGARGDFAGPARASLLGCLGPLIGPTLALMQSWRAAKRLRARLQPARSTRAQGST